ncbi:unannotated protein [freshwater metagenome]|uniref:Unannotated protein n=1 Tax=freshwater metagenome TaxID=449393 RepID=A0A6J6KRG9_9ZZZZ
MDDRVNPLESRFNVSMGRGIPLHDGKALVNQGETARIPGQRDNIVPFV